MKLEELNQRTKEAVDFLVAALESGHSEVLTAYLGAMAKFHTYSFGNIMLIARQKPDATNVAGLRTWNSLCRVPGPWYERLPHVRMGFTPSAGKELQAEYFIPRQHAVEAVLAVERLRDQVGPSLLITEIRTIAADNLWMSPCYQQDCVTIHFTWKPDWPAVSKLLPVIEKELAQFNARPHWGKLFTISATELKSIYKKMPEFVELCRRYDPQGKFRNEYLNRNIFAT